MNRRVWCVGCVWLGLNARIAELETEKETLQNSNKALTNDIHNFHLDSDVKEGLMKLNIFPENLVHLTRSVREDVKREFIKGENGSEKAVYKVYDNGTATDKSLEDYLKDLKKGSPSLFQQDGIGGSGFTPGVKPDPPIPSC